MFSKPILRFFLPKANFLVNLFPRKLNTMNTEREEFEGRTDLKSKRYAQMRSIKDIGMGIVYLGVGILILFAGKLGLDNENLTGTPAKLFAGLVLIYGSWRIYRGMRKDYFK